MVKLCQLCAQFLVEDPDIDTINWELKDAFRIYDKDGQGSNTMDTLMATSSAILSRIISYIQCIVTFIDKYDL